MKKIITLLFFLLIVVLPIKVKALSVDKNSLTIEKGKSETIGLYAEVETEVTEINFTLVYTSYDVPAYFILEPGLTDQTPNSISHKIVFSEPVTGKIKLGTVKINVINNPKIAVGTINIHSAKAITTTDETVTLNAQTINVTIKKEELIEEKPEVSNPDSENKSEEKSPEKKNQNLLKKIDSEIVKIEIKENVYEYTVNIKSEIEELDLKPIAKDDKYKVEITSQKISELKDDMIVITVKDGENTEEYTIKVNTIKEVEEVEIDEEKFEPTYQYKGKWIVLIIILSITLFSGLLLNKKK